MMQEVPVEAGAAECRREDIVAEETRVSAVVLRLEIGRWRRRIVAMLEQLAQRSKKREYHCHAEDPRQRRPPPAEIKADGDDRGVNGYADQQPQDVAPVFRRDCRGSFGVRLTKQQHLDCPYSKGRLQEKEQIEREEIGEFRVARGAQLPMMLEMD